MAQRAASGDREAMADIVRLFYADVYRFCSRIVGADAADDATQEAFLIALRRIRVFRGESTLKTWLFGIALNVTRNMKRKRLPLPLADWDHSNSEDPSDQLIDAERLRCALAKLSPEHREVVILHEMEGLSYDECGHVVGIPSGTVKSRLHHAFRQLRLHLEGAESA
ncbi:MAG: sigma-70 family RNA polymerase sigma factor [Fimbriimonadales bacterium]|nr:sigma-70 family RNA polymerase sigma factor [Fimbriimonadales bacterium]